MTSPLTGSHLEPLVPSVRDQMLRLRFTLTASSVELPDSSVVTAVHASGGDIRASRVIAMTAKTA